MLPLEATIVDIHLDIHTKGPNEQEIYVEYVVDGVAYGRELKTDTAVSFEAGRGAHYAIGDKIPIFYDPQNPEIIASPRSMAVGVFFAAVALLGLVLVVIGLIVVVKNRRQYLVTREDYDQEGEALKASRIAQKQRKKQARSKRRKKYGKAATVLKVLLVAAAALIAASLLGHFFRGFIRGLTG